MSATVPRPVPRPLAGLARAAVLLCGLTAILLAVRYGGGMPARLSADADGGEGLAAMSRLVLIGALACAVGLPRQAVAFAAGALSGPWLGASLALAAQVAGCLATFFWARYVAGTWVSRRLPARLRALDARLAARPFLATLGLRLLPVGNNLALTVLGGVSSAPAGRFLAASALGYLPQTVIFALLGSGIAVSRWTEVAVGLALFALATLAGLAAARRAPVSAAA